MKNRGRKRKADSGSKETDSSANYARQTRAQQRALNDLLTPAANLSNNCSDHVHAGGATTSGNGQSGSTSVRNVIQDTPGTMAEPNVVVPAAEVGLTTTANSQTTNLTVRGIQTGAMIQNPEQQQVPPIAAGTSTPGEHVSIIKESIPLINNTSVASVSSISSYPAVVQNSQGVSPGGMGIRPTALVSVCEPLGVGIASATKEKIIKGEFIDLGSLLERQRVPSSSPPNLAFSFNTSGQVVLKEATRKIKIFSIQAWTDAFLIFSSIFLGAHPNRCQELLKYMHFIRAAASRFPSSKGWLDYDEQFRLRQQEHPERSWAVIDSELWAVCVTSPRPFQSSFDSYRPQPPAQSTFTSRYSARFMPAASPPCFSFNRNGCFRTRCRYSHKCTGCGSPAHGATSCKKSAGARPRVTNEKR